MSVVNGTLSTKYITLAIHVLPSQLPHIIVPSFFSDQVVYCSDSHEPQRIILVSSNRTCGNILTTIWRVPFWDPHGFDRVQSSRVLLASQKTLYRPELFNVDQQNVQSEMY